MTDIYVDSGKHEPALSLNKSGIDDRNDVITKKEKNDNEGTQLSVSTEELIDGQNNETFCTAILKLVHDNKIPQYKYFKSDNRLLHQVVREDYKLFHAVMVPLALSKYILHQAHDALGHNGL